jgi:hypothetical protein
MDEIKVFAIKLFLLVAIAPLVGYYMLKFADLVEVAWKTNDRKKKWIVMCTLFACIAGLSGWLR